MYTQKEIDQALKLYDRIHSLRKMVTIPGYPSLTLMQRWIKQRRQTGKVVAKTYRRRDTEKKKAAAGDLSQEQS